MKLRVSLTLCLAAACLLGGASVRAQGGAGRGSTPETASMDLAEVLRIVREVSPRLAIQREGVRTAEAGRITAGAYPNPSVSFGRSRPSGGQSTLFTGTRQDQASLDMPLLIAGQRSARLDRAEREIEAARTRVDAGASSLAAEASAAFVSLLAAQEKAALLAHAGNDLGRLRDIVRGRAEQGVASRYDLARLEIEFGSFRARLDDAQADIADRAGSLAALLGLPQLTPRAVGVLGPLQLGADALKAPRDRAPASPAVSAAAGEERAARSGIEVARSERWPVPSVSVGRAWTSDPFGAANFLGLSVEIPIFDTRRGPVARAESEAAARAAGLPRDSYSVVHLDLASLDSVRAFVDAFRASGRRLDALVANAAVYLPTAKEPRFTADGFELSVGTNHLGHFLLCRLMLEDLEGSPPAAAGRAAAKPRMVIVGSITGNTNTLAGNVPPKADLGDLRGLAAGIGPGTSAMMDGAAGKAVWSFSP